jgi:GTP-binding protein
MSLFQNATYLASAHHLQDLPPPGEPEVAFAGRSNAGKSSAINALANRTRLAFVSKTPGRTQQINFFQLAGGGLLGGPAGYGYAKVPYDTLRTPLGAHSSCSSRRARPCVDFLVMDARHPLTGVTRYARLVPAHGPAVHILLTKADKLTRSEQVLTLRKVRARLKALGGTRRPAVLEPGRSGLRSGRGDRRMVACGAPENRSPPKGKAGAKGLGALRHPLRRRSGSSRSRPFL